MNIFRPLNRSYSLKKSRHILKVVHGWYKKKSQTLSTEQRVQLESNMEALDKALLSKDSKQATFFAKQLETFSETHCKKTFFEYSWELLIALVFALIIATLVRQVWFELYEIPTGSMRPTFREQDHLTVTKTAFGINFPLETKHLYFDPSLVQRTSVLIFSGDQLPLSDTDTTFFGIFPYKKRFIKRCIGKPGDSLYFYGGRLFGVDKDGNDIKELREAPWMQSLEYVPFLSYEGELVAGNERNTILLRQMHMPIGKFAFTPLGNVHAEIFNGKQWIKDQPLAQLKPHPQIETYSDFFGFRNYAVARLLTKAQLHQMKLDPENIGEGVLYLQLHHTPSLSYPAPFVYRGNGVSGIGILAYSTIIPLQQHHLDALMDNLYTARFVIQDGKAKRYSLENEHNPFEVPFANVENGTYEFYFGKASKIHWGGISTDVPNDSALYNRDPENIQKLFNLGIELRLIFSPSANNRTLFPHRYAYFRDGDLFLMGVPVLKKEDPTLKAFHENEQKREAASTDKEPYVAFKDYGPPMNQGKLDIEFIRTFGVTVPEKHYLVLGDNHAMSSDSRVFGFVPQNNLQGAPCWIIWPPGNRLGAPPQKPYPFMNLPRAIIWTVIIIIGLIWFSYSRKRAKKLIFVKKA